MNKLRLAVDELSARHGMYLPDSRYPTFVAFIEGFGLGAGDSSLAGFSDWLAEQWGEGPSSLHWSWLVAAHVRPELREVGSSLSLLSIDDEREAISQLLMMLTRYLLVSEPSSG
jgi:hypothetical protein